MAVFVFTGSKGGASRTTSSILLATGMYHLGLNPLLIQMAPPGQPLVLSSVMLVPFEIAWAPWDRPDIVSAQIRAHTQHGFAESHVIVDMPAQGVHETLKTTAEFEPRILLPMREGATDVEQAASDYREVWFFHGQDKRPPWVWILPVGWPPNVQQEDFATLLGRHRIVPNADGRLPLIRPGLPRLEPLAFDFQDDDARFRPTEEQREAAIILATAVLAEAERS
jgi:hypothetical protein